MRAKIKTIVSGGRGKVPVFEKGTKAVFHYDVRLLPLNYFNKVRMEADFEKLQNTELEVIEDSRKGWPKGYGEEMELIFGKEFQLPIFEECLETMIHDEVASFDVQPIDLIPYPLVSKKLRDIAKARAGHGHPEGNCCMALAKGTGYEELDKLIQEPRPLRFTFHLKKVLQPHEYEAVSWQLDPDEKLSSIEGLKSRGNAQFKKGEWRKAAGLYTDAIERLDTLMLREKPGEPEHIELDGGKTPFYLNLAQCQLNLEDYYEAIESTSEALKRDDKSSKGLFRRAKGYIAVWDLEKATTDLNLLVKLHPEAEQLATDELSRIEKLEALKLDSDTDVYKKMFK